MGLRCPILVSKPGSSNSAGSPSTYQVLCVLGLTVLSPFAQSGLGLGVGFSGLYGVNEKLSGLPHRDLRSSDELELLFMVTSVLRNAQ
jgi:hypothetical protein